MMEVVFLIIGAVAIIGSIICASVLFAIDETQKAIYFMLMAILLRMLY